MIILKNSLALWICGLVTGIFMMVGDELINLSLYCGLRCSYAIPLLGLLDIWNAWSLTFVLILASAFVSLIIANGDRS